MDLQSFLSVNGFTGDPFAHFNAEEEDLLAQYFVPPPYFNSVLGNPKQPKSCIVFAPRGGGKTAQRKILEEQSRTPAAAHICVLYDRFLPPPRGVSIVDNHLNQICLRVTLALLFAMRDIEVTGLVLEAEDRKFLTGEAALLDAVDAATFDVLIQSLKSDARRVGDWMRDHSGPIKAVVASLLAKRGIDLDPTTPWGPQMRTAAQASPLARLRRLISICQYLKYDSVYVLIDRLDETALTNTNPAKAIELVSDMLLDLAVMELPGLAVKVFAWDLSEGHYHDLGGRRDRVREYTLTWPLEGLETMMERRLSAYSGGNITSLDQLFDTASISFHRVASFMAHGSPRDMIRLCATVVSEHLNTGGAGALITEASLWRGVASFATEVCDERAKKFIPDLMRLDRLRFTQSKVANDYLKIAKQSTQAKVTDWKRTAMIDKLSEVQDARRRPQHLYGVIDPRLAIHLRPSVTPQEVLEFFVFQCRHCKTVNYSDDSKFVCSGCQRGLSAASEPSIISLCSL